MKTCLVLGGASCLQADVTAAMGLGPFAGTVACNDSGTWWPGQLDGWVSLHSGKLTAWARQRAKQGFTPASRLAGHLNETSRRPELEYVDHRFPGQIHVGSSGLFAVKFALLDLGFDRAVCCGLPMDEQCHFFRDAPWTGAKSHRRGWQEALPAIKDKVRSLSGWTADLLGCPSAEWIAGA